MGQCSACRSEIAADSNFCPKCGTPSHASSEAATMVMPASHGSGRVSATASRLSVSTAVDEGRFPPGTLLAQRYRVGGRLGKGGMGEVYKATDLLVGQTVALKFLPEELAGNESMLERFRNEVRLARQVSHPNVCRVYDLAESDGHLFLSMEYIDGEDLSSLLRRIGHLPAAKARETAHKLCAGLAAAHEKGVIHRDFKPANIMIDGRGQVMITDFGLAAASNDEIADVRSGTPAYMAPEQLTGAEVTPRSDIYALGLVLYEIFTGHAPFEATSREDLLQKQAAGPPPMKDVDGTVEQTIGRCLEVNPKRRPWSAQAVASALAGGDPLQAALAAGQTPTPEMVAAAGERETMNPRAAMACLAAILVGAVVVAGIAGPGWAFSRVAAEIPPDAMAQKAREVLAHVGYPGKPVSAAWGYLTDRGRLQSLANLPHEEAWKRIANSRPSAVFFWYRQSPLRMAPVYMDDRHVGTNDPPLTDFGMLGIRLDPAGRLIRLVAQPQSGSEPKKPAESYAWQRLFESAGLDLSNFDDAQPQQTPLTAFDERGAWVERTQPAAADGDNAGSKLKLRVEAAALRGLPVWFSVTPDQPAQTSGGGPSTGNRGDIARVLFQLFILLGETALAWRNIKIGRGDTRGALRLGAAVALLDLAAGLLTHGHALDVIEYVQLLKGISEGLLDGALMAAGYLAFEPFIRRRWPGVLISWTRMLSGAARDPLVGRHVLIGLCGGVALVTIYKLHDLLQGPSTVGAQSVDLYAAANTARILGMLANCASAAFADACWATFLVFFFALLVRNRWVAAACASLLWAGVQALSSVESASTLGLWLLVFGILYALLFRWGLLACFAYAFAGEVMMDLPVTLDTGAWYFGASALAMAAVGLAGWYAFRVAVGGRAVWAPE
jgi:serine/threonine-protein kinase